MILFIAPVGVALAHRRPKQPAPYPHLSMWRLLGGEVITGLQNPLALGTTSRTRRRSTREGTPRC